MEERKRANGSEPAHPTARALGREGGLRHPWFESRNKLPRAQGVAASSRLDLVNQVGRACATLRAIPFREYRIIPYRLREGAICADGNRRVDHLFLLLPIGGRAKATARYCSRRTVLRPVSDDRNWQAEPRSPIGGQGEA